MVLADAQPTSPLCSIGRYCRTAKARAAKDGTLDAKEAAGHISKANFKAADPDNDKTLSKDEYAGLAASLFKAADPDHDGTLDAKELRSTAGRELGRLIK